MAKTALQREVQRDRWMAWHIAALSRAKQMPSFEAFMRSSSRQTPEEQAAMWAHIGDTLGTRRRHDPKRYRIVRSYGKRVYRRHA